MNFIFLSFTQNQTNFASWLLIPIPVNMTVTCQSVKASHDLSTEPELTSFLFLYNFSHVFWNFYHVPFDTTILETPYQSK